MDIQDKINQLESDQLAIKAVIAESDRAALDYVKSLPGFAEAYPEVAARLAAARADEAAADQSLEEVKAEWELHIGEPVAAGDIIFYQGMKYIVLQPHTLQADWRPDEVPALYKRQGSDGGEEFPEWVRPTGGHDAYNAGDKVSYNSKHYESLIDGNVWSPDEYPAGWKEV